MKTNRYELLQKSEAAADNASDPSVTEAFDAAMATLNTELSDELIKAKKAHEKSETPAKEKKEEHEAEETLDEEGLEEAAKGEGEGKGEDDDDQPELPLENKIPLKGNKKKMKKSIVEELADDPEAEAAMDVEPFLKALAQNVSDRIEALEKSVLAAVAGVVQTQTSISKVILAEGDMLKSALKMDRESAAQPLPRQSVQTIGRFTGSDGKPMELSKAQAQSALVVLAKSGKMNPIQVSTVESRINKGGELPDYFVNLVNKTTQEA